LIVRLGVGSEAQLATATGQLINTCHWAQMQCRRQAKGTPVNSSNKRLTTPVSLRSVQVETACGADGIGTAGSAH
jgi:hypothetical protein